MDITPLLIAFVVFGIIDLIFVGSTMISVRKLVVGLAEGKVVLKVDQVKHTKSQTESTIQRGQTGSFKTED